VPDLSPPTRPRGTEYNEEITQRLAQIEPSGRVGCDAALSGLSSESIKWFVGTEARQDRHFSRPGGLRARGAVVLHLATRFGKHLFHSGIGRIEDAGLVPRRI